MATIERLRFMVVVQSPEEAAEASGKNNELDDGLVPDSYGKDIVILAKREDGRTAGLPIPLTSLTLEELNALEGVLVKAISAARPIVAERDRIAEEAANNGDDTYYRRHRSSPKVSEFPGKI